MTFNHSERQTKVFYPQLGWCVCKDCMKLPYSKERPRKQKQAQRELGKVHSSHRHGTCPECSYNYKVRPKTRIARILDRLWKREVEEY